MAKADQKIVSLRITIEQPVAGVLHSLQARDGSPLDPEASVAGESLRFDFQVRMASGHKLAGDQVRREGPTRKFVYIRIGDLAGDPSSPWSRRMKIDIDDIDPALLDRAAESGEIIELVVGGTGKDGTPACATVRPTARRIVQP